LERKGYVVAEGEIYTLGLRFLNYGEHVKRSQPLYDVANLSIEELAAETGKGVFCMVEQHDLETVICVGEGSQSVQTDIRVGTHSYMHCSSAGKAILAHLPDDRVAEIIDQWGLRQFTDQTITDRSQLLNDLQAGRERGFFFNREEYREDVTSIGAPVLNDDTVYGAIAISGPAMSLQGDLLDTELPDQLLTTVNMVEVNMSFS
jgi:DNA-binding IclR family transcriptional regulator